MQSHTILRRFLAAAPITCLFTAASLLAACAADTSSSDDLAEREDGEEELVGTASSAVSYSGGKPGFLITIGNGMCLTALPNETVVQKLCAWGNAMQRWSSRQTATGVEMQNVGNSRCLNLVNGQAFIHAVVNTALCDGTAKQRFHYMNVPNTTIEQSVSAGSWKTGLLVPDGSALCLDLAGGNNNDGNPLQLFSCHSGSNQVFNVRGGPYLLSEHTDSEDYDYIMEFHTFVQNGHIDVRVGPGERATFDSQPYVSWSAWEWGNASQQLDPDTGDTQCDSGTTLIFVRRTAGSSSFHVGCYR